MRKQTITIRLVHMKSKTDSTNVVQLRHDEIDKEIGFVSWVNRSANELFKGSKESIEINCLTIALEYRMNGLAKQLMAEALTQIPKDSIVYVMPAEYDATSTISTERLRQFYSGYGFTRSRSSYMISRSR